MISIEFDVREFYEKLEAISVFRVSFNDKFIYKTYIPFCAYFEHNSLSIYLEGNYLEHMLQGIMEHTFSVIIKVFEITMEDVLSIFPNFHIKQSGKSSRTQS